MYYDVDMIKFIYRGNKMSMLNQDIYKAKYKTGKLSVIKVNLAFHKGFYWDSLGMFKCKKLTNPFKCYCGQYWIMLKDFYAKLISL